MKILYLTDIVPNMVSGPSNAVPLRIAAQAKFDEVFWINVNDYFKWQSTEYQFDFGDEWRTRNLSDIPFTPDIIVFQGVYPWIKSSNYAKDARKGSIPYVVIPHAQLRFNSRNSNFVFLVLGTPRQFDVFISNAKAIQFFNKQHAESSTKFGAPVIIIPNGVPSQEQITRTYQNKCNALYVGKFDVYRKGLDLLFEGLEDNKELLAELGFHLDMYGVGSIGTYFSKFQLQEIVTMHPPVIDQAKDDAFRSADMFILPSRREGQSIALLEALSYSLPVVATVSTNMGQEILSANAGYIAEPTIESIADNLLSFIRSMPDKYESMSKAAYNLSQNYTWDKIASTTHRTYTNLLNS